MASALVTTRKRESGNSYVVRYRLGGRAYPLVHGGSFRTMKEARARRDLIAGELAAGRNPADVLRQLTATPTRQTFADWADRWLETRVDLAPSTAANYSERVKWLKSRPEEMDPFAMTPADVQELAAKSGLSPRTTQAYVRVLKMILDFVGVDPNPARDRRVRLPRIAAEPMNPPSWKHVEAIVANVRKSLRLPVTILAETGLRQGELLAWTWGDVDATDCRIRVAQGKTKAAMRWVEIRSELMDELIKTCPPDDRAIDRRLFPELGRDTLRSAIRRACVNAGIPHYHPHDFRHRHISVLLKQGLSRAEVAASVGHSNTNTLAVYEHVVLDE